MYSKCGMVGEAGQMFNTLPVRNVISWNAMIAGYSNERNGEEALNLFREMQEKGEVPDRYTYSSSLKACSCAGAVGEGMQIHAALIKHGFPYLAQSAVAGALVDIYVKCRRMAEARRVFDRIEVKSMMSRSTVILGYAQEDNLTEAMDLFRELRESRYRMDGFVLSSLMGVFADFALVEQGKQMHAYTIKVPYGLLEMSVANSVLDMYMQCGLTDEADALFREMLPRNVVSWTVMIPGYGKHGYWKESEKIRETVKRKGLKKVAGRSWVEMDKEIHIFYNGDGMHLS
ncbi:putative pentatricopeptide repeat-containing protein [Glycine soja]